MMKLIAIIGGATGLAARGESPASHRGRRGAPLTRRDDGEYREYLTKEQRSQRPGPPPRVFQRGGVERGCIAGRMQLEFHHGLLALLTIAIGTGVAQAQRGAAP